LERGKIAGRACRVVRIVDPESKSSGRAWIDLSTGLPLRIETSGKSGAVELSAVSIQLNPALPDALFTLPKGYSVTRLPTRSFDKPTVSNRTSKLLEQPVQTGKKAG
ncbi:MAG: sigma-E factor regulatory protein RseB domain-containing protein, partial [Anaerolineae bacterium]